MRLTILDLVHAPASITDWVAPPAEVAALVLRPEVAFIFQELQIGVGNAQLAWCRCFALRRIHRSMRYANSRGSSRRARSFAGAISTPTASCLHTYQPTTMSVSMYEQILLDHREIYGSPARHRRAPSYQHLQSLSTQPPSASAPGVTSALSRSGCRGSNPSRGSSGDSEPCVSHLGRSRTISNGETSYW